MPTYSATGPVICLRPGIVDKLFDAETPANGTKSIAAAVPPSVKSVMVEIDWAAVPVGPNVSIQWAAENVDADYREVASSVDTTGEAIPIPNFVGGFLRAVKNGGDQALTVKVISKSER